MEIILAIVVASAVIFFGALISMGNERQRRAIDGLREQMVLWAVQDLKIKRKHLEQTVQVPDPVEWLNKMASKACGYKLNLRIEEILDDPKLLICISMDENARIIFSPLSPSEIKHVSTKKKGRLSQLSTPILKVSTLTKTHEISTLNSGFFFDLELSIVWKTLTNQSLDFSDTLWVYEQI